MGRKAFKVGDIVVGKTRSVRNKRGKVIASGLGAKRNLTRVRWTCGKVDEVTSYAIDVVSMPQMPSPVADSTSEEEVDESEEGEDWTSQYGSGQGSIRDREVRLRINRRMLDLFLYVGYFSWVGPIGYGRYG